MDRNKYMKDLHMERLKSSKEQNMQRTLGTKRVMVNEEKRLFDRRIRDEENDYFRKRKIREEIDFNKRQFIHMKIESQRIIENQQRQNYQLLQEERHHKINHISDKVSYYFVIFNLFFRFHNLKMLRDCQWKNQG